MSRSYLYKKHHCRKTRAYPSIILRILDDRAFQCVRGRKDPSTWYSVSAAAHHAPGVPLRCRSPRPLFVASRFSRFAGTWLSGHGKKTLVVILRRSSCQLLSRDWPRFFLPLGAASARRYLSLLSCPDKRPYNIRIGSVSSPDVGDPSSRPAGEGSSSKRGYEGIFAV